MFRFRVLRRTPLQPKSGGQALGEGRRGALHGGRRAGAGAEEGQDPGRCSCRSSDPGWYPVVPCTLAQPAAHQPQLAGGGGAGALLEQRPRPRPQVPTEMPALLSCQRLQPVGGELARQNIDHAMERSATYNCELTRAAGELPWCCRGAGIKRPVQWQMGAPAAAAVRAYLMRWCRFRGGEREAGGDWCLRAPRRLFQAGLPLTQSSLCLLAGLSASCACFCLHLYTDIVHPPSTRTWSTHHAGRLC